jgi:hypothetical protein
MFFASSKKKKIFHFVIFVATKKGRTKNKFSPLSFVFGSVIRNGQNSGYGIGINIPDPQHWFFSWNVNFFKPHDELPVLKMFTKEM